VDPLVPRVEDRGAAGTLERLGSSPYFACDRLRLRGESVVGSPDRFTILMSLEGRCSVLQGSGEYPLDFGQTMLLPASSGECRIVPHDEAVVLSCVVP
jgi:mannose-6-phosphate isomerase class I